MTNVIELAKACPNAIIQIKVEDLIVANEALVAKTKSELEQLVADANAETYLSREKVAEMLDIDLSTLYRWNKRGYLVSIRIGGKVRYRTSDVRKLLNGGRA